MKDEPRDSIKRFSEYMRNAKLKSTMILFDSEKLRIITPEESMVEFSEYCKSENVLSIVKDRLKARGFIVVDSCM